MPRNATVQIKTLTPRQAVNRVNENLRLGLKYDSPNIVVLEDNFASTSFSTEKKERSSTDKEIGRKINALRSSIKTYEKRINQTDDEKKRAKMQSKVTEYLTEISNLEGKKSGEETRGRKKEKHFVELIFSLTNTEPSNHDLNNRFALAQKKYLEMHFKQYELVTNVVHLDQHSVHSHAIVKIPKGKTWTQTLLDKKTITTLTKNNRTKKLYEALKQGYANIARHFQDFMSKELNIKFDKLKNGVFYKSLSKYKKQTGFGSCDENKLGADIKKLNDILDKSKKINLNHETQTPTKYQLNEIPDETEADNDDTQHNNKPQKRR